MLKLLAPDDAGRLREFFREAKYTQAELQGKRILQELSLRKPGNLPILLDEIREPSLINLLLRWFILGSSTEDGASTLVPDAVLKLMLEAGMLERDGSSLRPTVTITPCEQYIFAADTMARLDHHAADLVVWPNPTTRALHHFTIRNPFKATLDLGGGCGVQAILAAAHSQRVTSTDLNPRAEEFAYFNARLNGLENVECLTGDTFAPTYDRVFDLIVANPPFFITPSGGPLYCENSMELDQYCRRVAKEAPDHIKEGGYFQMLFEWVQLRGQTWQDRVREWVEGSGCDACVFRTYSRSAEDYARERISQGTPSGTEAETLAQWMSYYRQRMVEEIHGGMLALRRRAGRNWVRMEEMPIDPVEPFGDAVWQCFACIDWLEAHTSDAQMLAAKPRLSPYTQLEQQSRPAEGRWQTVGMTLRFTAGIPNSMRVDPPVADFLVRLDGKQKLGDVIADLAQRVQANPQVVQRECLAVVRKLTERRFILP